MLMRSGLVWQRVGPNSRRDERRRQHAASTRLALSNGRRDSFDHRSWSWSVDFARRRPPQADHEQQHHRSADEPRAHLSP